MNKAQIEVILFDLGGVLVELGKHPIAPEWISDSDSFELKDWFDSPTAINFELGLANPQQFANSLIQERSLNASPTQIIEHFTAWPVGLFPGVQEMLSKLRESYKLAVLSNTNELHWPRMLSEFKLDSHIETLFASHLIHKAKPNINAYEHVLQGLAVQPEAVLFFDDNASNVASAKSVGINAILVSGYEDLMAVLRDGGFL